MTLTIAEAPTRAEADHRPASARWHQWPHFDEEQIAATVAVLRSGKVNYWTGEEARAFERRRILTRHLRPVMIECLRSARRSDAWRMYRATFGWHVEQGRWRFLAAFPFMALSRTA